MIGIIAAMEEEMIILKEAFENPIETNLLGISFYEGKIGKHDIVLCRSGVGKVNASMATACLIHAFECSLIINTGIAGGITGVEPEDIVLVGSLCYADVNVCSFGYAFGQIPGMPNIYYPNMNLLIQVKQILKKLGYPYKEGRVYTSDSFISDINQIERVDRTLLCVAEMEGAAIAQVCTKAMTDFIVLRYVSDIVGHPSQIDDYQQFESQMARRSSKICLEIIRNLE